MIMYLMWCVYSGFELFIYGEWLNIGICICIVIVNLI